MLQTQWVDSEAIGRPTTSQPWKNLPLLQLLTVRQFTPFHRSEPPSGHHRLFIAALPYLSKTVSGIWLLCVTARIISVPAIDVSGGTQQNHAVSRLWLPYWAVTESDQESPAALWPVTSSTRLFMVMICYDLPFISVSPTLTLPRDSGICPAFEVILFPVLYRLLLNHLPALSSVFSITQRCRHMYAKSLLVYLGLYWHRETCPFCPPAPST